MCVRECVCVSVCVSERTRLTADINRTMLTVKNLYTKVDMTSASTVYTRGRHGRSVQGRMIRMQATVHKK